ncbi:MAG TPA: helix-turn-helix domain-containing protein [Pyrinomonadaceae bacterium]|nr:helix-turn-helix domain-containing protein [Pyrinomonadaceae bacterium]
MNEKQRRRCEIVTRLIARKISNREAGELLGLGSRPGARRIRQRYEAEGLETVVHGNQDRPSPRRTEASIYQPAARTGRTRGPVSRFQRFPSSRSAGARRRRQDSSLYLVAAADRAPHSSAATDQAAVKRMQRERKSAEGMMLQTDAPR